MLIQYRESDLDQPVSESGWPSDRAGRIPRCAEEPERGRKSSKREKADDELEREAKTYVPWRWPDTVIPILE